MDITLVQASPDTQTVNRDLQENLPIDLLPRIFLFIGEKNFKLTSLVSKNWYNLSILTEKRNSLIRMNKLIFLIIDKFEKIKEEPRLHSISLDKLQSIKLNVGVFENCMTLVKIQNACDATLTKTLNESITGIGEWVNGDFQEKKIDESGQPYDVTISEFRFNFKSWDLTELCHSLIEQRRIWEATIIAKIIPTETVKNCISESYRLLAEHYFSNNDITNTIVMLNDIPNKESCAKLAYKFVEILVQKNKTEEADRIYYCLPHCKDDFYLNRAKELIYNKKNARPEGCIIS